MSIRDGLEPSRSPDSETHTQPLSQGEAPLDDSPAASPADETWPPSWGQSPSSWGESPAPEAGPSGTQPPAPAAGSSWTPPKAAQGPSWTQPTGSSGERWRAWRVTSTA